MTKRTFYFWVLALIMISGATMVSLSNPNAVAQNFQQNAEAELQADLFTTTAADLAPAPQNFRQNGLAPKSPAQYNLTALSTEKFYAEQLEGLEIHVAAFQPGNNSANRSLNYGNYESALNHCKSLVFRTLKSLPENAVKKLKNLTLQFTDQGRRGYGGGTSIVLRCNDMDDEELVGVLVHEIGHIIDTGLYQGAAAAGASEFSDGDQQLYNDDISVKFYRFSFKNEGSMKDDASPLDFVSGYAMTNPFEDFAETYNYYLLHGNDFRKMRAYSAVLRRKYNFMKYRIFEGKEFGKGKDAAEAVTVLESRKFNALERYFDTTVLPFDLENFFQA